MIDRNLQRTQTFTGITGVNAQDMALEHLGTSDRAIIAMRQLLLEALDANERGEAPRGLDPQTYRRVRAVDKMVPLDVPWREALGDELLARF